jgi:hypothetical protein
VTKTVTNKHTRVIHLKQDGARDSDIMQVTGHISYQAYAEHLRDLGVDGNPEAINRISRKFWESKFFGTFNLALLWAKVPVLVADHPSI